MSVDKEIKLAHRQFYKCPFYWGKIDRKKAETTLKNQPNGSYLMKNPEKEDKDEKKWLGELAFKVNSKYYYCRIRLDYLENKSLYFFFTFDPHPHYDYAAQKCRVIRDDSKFNYLSTLLMEISKSNELFSELFSEFENPILRTKPFSLLELARNEISNTVIKDEDISKLKIPKVLQNFLKEC